jgi:hypothetical protein
METIVKLSYAAVFAVVALSLVCAPSWITAAKLVVLFIVGAIARTDTL